MIYSRSNPSRERINDYRLNNVEPLGIVKNLLGEDRIITDSIHVQNVYMKIDRRYIQFDEVDDFAQNEHGEMIKVKLFIWRANDCIRGLVISIHDHEILKYAKEKYDDLISLALRGEC